MNVNEDQNRHGRKERIINQADPTGRIHLEVERMSTSFSFAQR